MESLTERARGLVRSSDPPFLRLGRNGSISFIVWGCLVITAWQSYSILWPETLDYTTARVWAGKGLYGARAQKYFYFYYYKNLFPVTVMGPASLMDWSPDGADRALTRRQYLHMEDYAYVRTGDLGKIFMLLPHAWFHGTPIGATAHVANRVLGVAALLSVFIALSLVDHRLLAIALVAFLGSNPMQLRQLYVSNNIFGLPIAVATIALAVHVPLILTRRTRGYYVVAVVTGAVLASVREIRTEPSLVVASVLLVYAFAPGGWRRRGGLVALLLVSFLVSSQAWSGYWKYKFDQAYQVVEAAGGTTFDGPRNQHHAFWHAIWCGLGDYDRKYGYRWYDRAAYEYGIPRVNMRFNREYKLMRRGYLLKNYHTHARKHRVKPENLEEYSIVLRDKVLGDIRADPKWYLDIVRKRITRIFSQTTPIRLAMGKYRLDIPFTAWLFFPAIVGLTLLRKWGEVKLLLFYGTTSASSLLVFSDRGLTYFSAFHFMLAALMFCWVVNLGALAGSRRGRS